MLPRKVVLMFIMLTVADVSIQNLDGNGGFGLDASSVDSLHVLPISHRSTDGSGRINVEVELERPLDRSNHRPKVLVVEDSLPNRRLLMMLIKQLDCEVVGVEDGQKCVDLLTLDLAARSSSNLPTEIDLLPPLTSSPSSSSTVSSAVVSSDHFSIILMDNQMPILSGVSATASLRSLGITIPIIGVTGNSLAEDINAFMAAGAQKILTKPVSRLQLLQVLQEYLPAKESKFVKDQTVNKAKPRSV